MPGSSLQTISMSPLVQSSPVIVDRLCEYQCLYPIEQVQIPECFVPHRRKILTYLATINSVRAWAWGWSHATVKQES